MKAKISNVPVVILCGGQGTRMREDGEMRPKPMVEIGDKPILWHIMKIYAHHGYRRFILPLGYKSESIKKYFRKHGPPSWEIDLVDTGVKTLKGARIKRIAPFIKADHFHLTYGDGVANVDVKKLFKYHLNHGKLGSVSVVRPPSRFGEMQLSGNRVKSFEEKPQMSTGSINGGFFVFRKEFLKYLSKKQNCDLEFGALQKIAKKNQLRAYQHKGFWHCMDTPRERDFLNKLWGNGAPWKVWK